MRYYQGGGPGARGWRKLSDALITNEGVHAETLVSESLVSSQVIQTGPLNVNIGNDPSHYPLSDEDVRCVASMASAVLARRKSWFESVLTGEEEVDGTQECVIWACVGIWETAKAIQEGRRHLENESAP